MLSEAMLACSGVINRLGSVPHGTTVSDYHEAEQKRQISIQTSLLHVEWRGKKFNIIDTPGYVDFISESLGALRVSDFAVVVVRANQGVAIGTLKVWDYATRFGLPKILVLNAFDQPEISYDKAITQVKDKFGDKVLPFTVPVNVGPGFNQVLDVLNLKILTFQTDGSGKSQASDPTGEWQEKARQLHQDLVERVAESDDALLEKFFEQGSLSEAELQAHVHRAVMQRAIIPLFCTTGTSNVGVSPLLDFIATYGPAPVDHPEAEGKDAEGNKVEVQLTNPDPVLFIFKTISEAHVGDLSFFRVLSGSAEMGIDLLNSTSNVSERIGQIFTLNGKNRVAATRLQAGDIGAVVKLKNTHTGDTLCSAKHVVVLPQLQYPKPNIHAALHMKVKGEEEKIAMGLSALHQEDPTFIYHVDGELHQTVISGQGDLHLEVISDRLKKRYKVDFDLIEPKVAFRETIKAKAESKYRHKKQTGGAGQFAEVWMRIEPRARNSGVEFVQTLSGQNVDRAFVPSVEKGVLSACKEGVVAGYRIVDIKIDFYDGKMHPVDSKDIAFQIAGKQAFRESFVQARPCLLEPIHTVEIRIPEECMGNVIGDLSSRRGKILGLEAEAGFQIVKAQVPAMELYHYSSTLRSLTGGRGAHTEDFSHYEEMPRELEQKVIEKHKQPAPE